MYKRKYVKEKIVLYLFKIMICALFTGGMYYCWMNYFNPFVPIPFFRYGIYLLSVLFLAVYV